VLCLLCAAIVTSGTTPVIVKLSDKRPGE
jgi:hypothetical protein